MYNISSLHRNALDSGSRGIFGAYITMGDTEIRNIHNIEFKSASSAGGNINIGACISSSITFELEADTLPEDLPMNVHITMNVKGDIQDVPMGKFNITEAQEENGIWTGTAYDNLIKANEPYTSSLEYPNTLDNMCKEAADICGVEFEDESVLPVIVINEAPENKTCAWLFGIAAQFLGMNVFANRDGRITFKWYEQSIGITATQHYEFSKGDETYLNSISCDIESEKIISGSGKGISITNSYMTQSELDSILEKRRLSYVPIKTSFIGDMTVDPWDIILVSDINGTQYELYVMSLTLQYDGGLLSQAEAYGETAAGAYVNEGRLSKKIVAVEKSIEQYKIYVAENFINGDKLSSALTLNNNQILMQVSETYANKTEVSEIKQTVDSISMSLKDDYATKAELALSIDNNKIATLSAYANEIKFTADVFSLESTYASITKTGVVKFTSGTIGGFTLTDTQIYSSGDTADMHIGTYEYDTTNRNALLIRTRASASDSWSTRVRFRYDGSAYFAGDDSYISISDGRMVIAQSTLDGTEANMPRITFKGAYGVTDSSCNLVYFGDKSLKWNGTYAANELISYGKITASEDIVTSKQIRASSIELTASTPFIDFHYNNSTDDYTSRIREAAAGILQIQCDQLRVSAMTSGNVPIVRSSSGTCQFGASSDSYITYLSGSEVWVCNTARSSYKVIKASAFTVSSSKKLKDNIVAMTDDESRKIYELNVVTFDYINGEKNRRGLIAEEVANIIPSCVFGDINATDAEGIMGIGIDYSGFISYILKEMQKHENEINKLKASD